MGLFGKNPPPDPREKVRQWSAALRKESRTLDRQIRAMARVSGAFEKSTEVMRAMQALVKVDEVRETMMGLSKEMMKMGIVEEMMDDMVSPLDDSEELEEAAQSEIDKVLYDITAGALGKLPDSETHELPTFDDQVEVDEDEDVMQQRLEALRS